MQFKIVYLTVFFSCMIQWGCSSGDKKLEEHHSLFLQVYGIIANNETKVTPARAVSQVSHAAHDLEHRRHNIGSYKNKIQQDISNLMMPNVNLVTIQERATASAHRRHFAIYSAIDSTEIMLTKKYQKELKHLLSENRYIANVWQKE